MKNKEWNNETKLDKREKCMLLFYIVMAIFSVIVSILEKDSTWILVAILEINVFVSEYCNAKLRKGNDVIDDLQNNLIDSQKEFINSLLKEIEKKDEEIRILKSKRVNLFEQLECLEKKDKIIDEMAEYIGQDIRCVRPEIECNKMTHDCKECIKQYFERKVKG